jgi:hypothetical protein
MTRGQSLPGKTELQWLGFGFGGHLVLLSRYQTLGLRFVLSLAHRASPGAKLVSLLLSQSSASSGHLQGLLANSLSVSAAFLRLPESTSARPRVQVSHCEKATESVEKLPARGAKRSLALAK